MNTSRIPRPGAPPSPSLSRAQHPRSSDLISPCGTSTIAYFSHHALPTSDHPAGSSPSHGPGPLLPIPTPQASTRHHPVDVGISGYYSGHTGSSLPKGTRLPSLTVRTVGGGLAPSASPGTPIALPRGLPSSPQHLTTTSDSLIPGQPSQAKRRPRPSMDGYSNGPRRPQAAPVSEGILSASTSGGRVPDYRMISGGWSGPVTESQATKPAPDCQPRSCLRPPKTISSGIKGRNGSGSGTDSKPMTEPIYGRARALSSIVDTRPSSHVRLNQAVGTKSPCSQTNDGNPLAKTTRTAGTTTLSGGDGRGSRPNSVVHLTSDDLVPSLSSSFRIDSISAAPPHIRTRLRLLHNLASVLGVDQAAVRRIIDVSALLSRVDVAYERAYARGLIASKGAETVQSLSGGNGNFVSLEMTVNENVGASGVPIPRGGNGGSASGSGSGGGASASGEAMRASRSGGVLNMIKRLGRKSSVDAWGSLASASFTSDLKDGPVFGVSLNDAPAGSWCTSLIGGQRHELPLVVFTVVEEIYRRGMSQPGIFRLAGDGSRIGHLAKAFNMPPMYGDSLAISQEPIHNLAGLVKRYVRDLPEPLIDNALFPALVAFCAEPDSATSSPTLSLASSPNPGPELAKTAAKSTPSSNGTRSKFGTQLATTPEARVAAAQIMLKLLPPLHFSLVIYLLAFLGQLPLFPDNRLNVDSISIIFGPALCAPRGRGVAGLGTGKTGTITSGTSFTPNKQSSGSSSAESADSGGVIGGPQTASLDSECVSELVNQSQSCLAWLLRNWGLISQKVLDPPEPESPFGSLQPSSSNRTSGEGLGTGVDGTGDKTQLLSPIDLREPDSDRKKISGTHNDCQVVNKRHSMPQLGGFNSSKQKLTSSQDPERSQSAKNTMNGRIVFSDSAEVGSIMERSGTDQSTATGSSVDDGGGDKRQGREGRQPKRSASFTSLSGLVRKGGEIILRMDRRNSNLSLSRSFSHDKSKDKDKDKDKPRLKPSTPSPTCTDLLFPPTPDDPEPKTPPVNPQITNVLGSLHELLVSKDRQIERDAKELALLRHTLLVMDERLRGATSTSAIMTSDRSSSPPPRITITSTPSSATLNSKDKNQDKERDRQTVELRNELSTALSSMEELRSTLKQRDNRIAELESLLAKEESARSLEVGRLEVALALEQAKVVGLREERDLAKERLDKVKTTLFAVA